MAGTAVLLSKSTTLNLCRRAKIAVWIAYDAGPLDYVQIDRPCEMSSVCSFAIRAEFLFILEGPHTRAKWRELSPRRRYLMIKDEQR
jgi:hypothetical protein